MLLRKNPLAMLVASVCAVNVVWASEAATLPEVKVVETLDEQGSGVSLNKTQIERKQPRDLKALFADQLDVQVNDLQGTRSGNAGVNVRGLQGNRVAMSVDGVPLPEGQENKLFVSLGQDFGAGNSVEPTALRSASVQHSGSFRALSGSVSFATLEPQDLIKSGNVGGFVASGYDSVDNSTYGSVGGAAKNERYEGLVLATGRFGNETENNAAVGGTGATRTKANPADYKNSYVLVKNGYQINDQHKLKLTFEHQQKVKDTELLSTDGISIDRATGNQISGSTSDQTRRTRVSVGHEYHNEKGWLNEAKTHLYFQNATSDNYRERRSNRAARVETGKMNDKVWGINSDLTTLIDSVVLQVLRYGFAFQYNDIKNDLACATCTTTFDPAASTKQSKTNLYIEDEIALGNVVLTPHLAALHFRSSPSKSGYVQAAEQVVEVKGQHKTLFLPKFTAQWKIDAAFEPFFQYSRGVKTPSAQQLTSSFGNTVAVGGRVVRQYAVVGNPNLRPEIADNFSLGFKGKNDFVQYNVAGYYNKYKDFIDWTSGSAGNYNPLIQYHNLDKAKIYGVTADAKVRLYEAFFVAGGVAYAKGKSEKNGEKSPINTIQPLKLKAGFGYEGENLGANTTLTHIRAKADKDIKGTIYNPTRSVNLVDLGVYWKPVKNLTLTANLNNVFDKKYWNWTDISYFAIQSSSESPDRTASLNSNNAETYTAPGRNFNLGVRYEF